MTQTQCRHCIDVYERNIYCKVVYFSPHFLLSRECTGEGGHGLSIGSLGKSGQVANVSNILFEDAVMVDELYAARFKSWSGGKGSAQK